MRRRGEIDDMQSRIVHHDRGEATVCKILGHLWKVSSMQILWKWRNRGNGIEHLQTAGWDEEQSK